MRYLLLSVLVVSLVGILMVPSVFAAQYDVREGTSIEFKTNTVCDVSEELAYAKNNICKNVFEQLTDDFLNIQWGNLETFWFVVTDVYDMGFDTPSSDIQGMPQGGIGLQFYDVQLILDIYTQIGIPIKLSNLSFEPYYTYSFFPSLNDSRFYVGLNISLP